MAYTGIRMLTGDNMKYFYDYLEEILGRKVTPLHIRLKSTWKEIKEKSREDFVKLCK